MSYEVLKNRLNNGEPYLLTTALERINALADNLVITQEQAEELSALAREKGVSVMPHDLNTRVSTLEKTIDMILDGTMDLKNSK